MSSPLIQVNGILEQFAVRVGLDACKLDDEGGAQFAFDDVLVSAFDTPRS